MGKRFAVCLAAVLCATGLSAPQRANPDRIERLRKWLSAVSRHEAGQQDDALFTVGAFSIGDVQTLMTDAQTLVTVIRNPRAMAFFLKSGKSLRQIQYTASELSALRDLAAIHRQREES